MYVNEVKPNDKLIGIDEISGERTVADFWRWAYSDLCDDDVKGIFAEWLVGRLLDLPMTRRFSWANCDIRTRDRVSIEVKSSAWWQSWRLLNGDGSPRERRAEPSKQSSLGGLSPGIQNCMALVKEAIRTSLLIITPTCMCLRSRTSTTQEDGTHSISGSGPSSSNPGSGQKDRIRIYLLKWLQNNHISLTAAEFRKAGLAGSKRSYTQGITGTGLLNGRERQRTCSEKSKSTSAFYLPQSRYRHRIPIRNQELRIKPVIPKQTR